MPDMNYITHSNMSILDQQVLTSFDWDYEIEWGNYIGYHPDMSILKARTLRLSDIDMTLENEPMRIPMRGFTLLQPGMTKSQSPSKPITITFQDFEDQSIKAWMLDYQNKMDSFATHKAYRRSDLMINLKVFRLDSSHRPVWQLYYKNCLPDSTQYTETFNENKDKLGECSITFVGEIMIPTPLNVA